MSAPLLEVENLGRQFVARRSAFGRPTAVITAVDAVSFSVEAGKTLALVGESGCGKTTLGRLVLRLIDPTAGRIRFEGRDVTALRERDLRRLRRNVQLIFQDPYGSLNPRMTVGQILAEPLALHDVVPSSRRAELSTSFCGLSGSNHAQGAATRMSFPGASGSALPLRARLRSSRSLSSATSRCRRWTFRSARRCSIYCAIYSAGLGLLTFSFRMTWPWSSTSPIASPSCISDALSRSAKRGAVRQSAAPLYPRAALSHSSPRDRPQTRKDHFARRAAEPA
jgi:peptide/nickel transport system ATP-binding protein/oligopeptide transport system ATP-binding protein